MRAHRNAVTRLPYLDRGGAGVVMRTFIVRLKARKRQSRPKGLDGPAF
jgi:hypothetical protein